MRGARDREPARSGDREAQEHDVSRHVGGEHVPEPQKADGVDDARHERQREEHDEQLTFGVHFTWICTGAPSCAAVPGTITR